MDNFYEMYKDYDGIDTDTIKHIPDISCYNHNYYIGLKRGNRVTHDLLFAHGDDDNQVDWYIVNGNSVTYIGYEFTDEGVLNLSDKNFT